MTNVFHLFSRIGIRGSEQVSISKLTLPFFLEAHFCDSISEKVKYKENGCYKCFPSSLLSGVICF